MAGALLVLGNCSSSAHGADEMARLARQAHARGLHVIGADTTDHVTGASAPVDEQVTLDVYDPRACARWAQANHGRIGTVFTYREMCVRSAAAAAAALGIPGNDPAAVDTIRNTDRCRARLAAAGFPQPEFALATTVHDALAFAARTKPPWIIKPRDAMGSSGIRLACTQDELASEFAGTGAGSCLMIETFVAGTEYSAEGIFLEGQPHVLALTAKQTGHGFIELAHEMPASLSETTAAHCESTVTAALHTVGLTHGIFHAEFWITGSGPVMGEIHARPGGDFLHALMEHIRPGLQLFGLVLDDLTGRKPTRVPALSRAAGIRYLMLPPGQIHSIHGWEQASRHPAVLAAHLGVRPGDIIGPPLSSADRHGLIAVGAPPGTDPGPLIDQLWRQVEIDFQPHAPVPATREDGR